MKLNILSNSLIKLSSFLPFIPKLKLTEQRSSLSFDASVEKITESVKSEGWSLLDIKRIDQSIKKHGLEVDVKVALIEICHPHHARAIVSDQGYYGIGDDAMYDLGLRKC
jgi:uncharacterized protein (DUF302 family)